ncbi:radical SAM protein [Thalassomonas sp. RHCl1]|uniref:radical SAM protein n=1 Tax=Thalassomonas sp. RHCl1 TaxID=2995320 RepID=UPI00248ACFAD|nr:radical SAM protein [Thalassomonas sp. RHCl1]
MNNQGFDFKKKYILAASEGHLYLTLLPTEKCNFRCTYCYEDFEIGKMSEDTVEGIKNLLTKAAPTLKNLMISWFGGEPTLNQKAIIDICSHIQQLRDEYEFTYISHMTTNAYLLDYKMFSTFVPLGVKDYQITLDGDQACHDTTRVQINGKGSFEQIWSNLKSYQQLDADFTVMLRLHITEQNSESMLALCRKIKSEFGADKRYTCTIEKINYLGDGVETSDASRYIAKNAKERVDQIKDLMSDTLDDRVKNVDGGNAYICYAAMPRQLLIRADGTIGKCTVMLNDERNKLGKIDRNGDFALDGEKMEIWTRGFISLDEKELSCPAQAYPTRPAYTSDIAVVEVS